MALTEPVFKVCVHRTYDGAEAVVTIDDLLAVLSDAAVRAWRAEPLREKTIGDKVKEKIARAFSVARPFAALEAVRVWQSKGWFARDERHVIRAVEDALTRTEANVLEAWASDPLRTKSIIDGAEAAIREAITITLEDAMRQARIQTVRL